MVASQLYSYIVLTLRILYSTIDLFHERPLACLQQSITTGKLFCGDSLEVLYQHMNERSADLYCLDPPFDLNAKYNVPLSNQQRIRWSAVLAWECATAPCVAGSEGKRLA